VIPKRPETDHSPSKLLRLQTQLISELSGRLANLIDHRFIYLFYLFIYYFCFILFYFLNCTYTINPVTKEKRLETGRKVTKRQKANIHEAEGATKKGMENRQRE
jgi:hypothetical protein